MGCADGVGTSSGNLLGLLEFGRAFARDTRGFCPITILRPISGDVEGRRGKAVLRKGGRVSLALGCGDGREARRFRGSKVVGGVWTSGGRVYGRVHSERWEGVDLAGVTQCSSSRGCSLAVFVNVAGDE